MHPPVWVMDGGGIGLTEQSLVGDGHGCAAKKVSSREMSSGMRNHKVLHQSLGQKPLPLPAVQSRRCFPSLILPPLPENFHRCSRLGLIGFITIC